MSAESFRDSFQRTRPSARANRREPVARKSRVYTAGRYGAEVTIASSASGRGMFGQRDITSRSIFEDLPPITTRAVRPVRIDEARVEQMRRDRQREPSRGANNQPGRKAADAQPGNITRREAAPSGQRRFRPGSSDPAAMAERRAQARARREAFARQNSLDDARGRSDTLEAAEMLSDADAFVSAGGSSGGSSAGGSSGASPGPSGGSSASSTAASATAASSAAAPAPAPAPAAPSAPSVGLLVPDVDAVWVQVDNRDCSSLAGFRTADLYLRVDRPLQLTALDTGITNAGITVVGSEIAQIQGGSQFGPPSSIPCVRFDSALSIGDAPDVSGNVNAFDSRIEAVWFSISGALARTEPDIFGDGELYVRIARITAPTEVTSISGQLDASFIDPAGGIASAQVSVPNCVDCWTLDLDFTNDPDAATGDEDDDGVVVIIGDGSGDTPDDDSNTNDPPTDGDSDNDGIDGDDQGDTDDGDTPSDGDDDADGNDPGGDGGDDGGGSSGDGGGGGGTLPDPGGDGEEPEGITAVWSPVPRTDPCEDLTGDGVPDPDFQNASTAELFIRFDESFRLFAVQSDPNFSEGLTVQSGEIRQHPLGASVAAPALSLFCLPFDSYIVIGNQPIDSHLVIGSPSTAPGAFVEPWPNPLDVLWLAFNQPDPDSVVLGDAAFQDPARFGDNAFYARAAQITAANGSVINGQVEVQIQLSNGDTTPFVIVDVPNCPTCWDGSSVTTTDNTSPMDDPPASDPPADETPGDEPEPSPETP